MKSKSSVYFSHPAALIEPGAHIGAHTRIWAYAHVLKGAHIGLRCNVGNYVFVEGGVHLGSGVTVKNGVQLWEGVTIEDNVFIGPGCIFTNHSRPRAFVKRPKRHWLQRTLLKRGCSVGAGAIILPGLTIGRYAFIAAGALITSNVPDYALMMGRPARFHSWRCLCAEALPFTQEKTRCLKCGSLFQIGKNGSSVRLIKPSPKMKHA